MTNLQRRVCGPAAALSLLLMAGCNTDTLAKATTPGEQVDTFVQVGHGKVDVLFVVDVEPTMQDEQTNLANNFPAFFDQLTAADIDYHIGVITTDVVADMGALKGNPTVVTTALSPGAAQNDFESNLSFPDTGSPLDQGLEAIRLFSTPAMPTVFARPDAYLFIIIVANSDDSIVTIGDPHYYYRLFSEMKGLGNNNMVKVSAIVGGDNGCINPVSNAEGQKSPNYDEVVQALGGQVFSICDPSFASSLTTLGIAAVDLTRSFALTDTPDLSTPIKVEVSYPCTSGTPTLPASCVAASNSCSGNPSVLTCAPTELDADADGGTDAGSNPSGSGWMYLPTVDAIEFFGTAIPPKGATIQVTYKAAGVGPQR